MGIDWRPMKFLNMSILQDSLSLLPRETPKKLTLLVLLQISISAFDILAILLLGMTSKLGLDYVQDKTVSFPGTLTSFLRINNHNFEVQAGIVSMLIVTLFYYTNSFFNLFKQANFALFR
jgi:hypothetical protein